jgi:hypothetical protein
MLLRLKPPSRIKNPKIQTPIHKNPHCPHKTASVHPFYPVRLINFGQTIKNSIKLSKIIFSKAHVRCEPHFDKLQRVDYFDFLGFRLALEGILILRFLWNTLLLIFRNRILAQNLQALAEFEKPGKFPVKINGILQILPARVINEPKIFSMKIANKVFLKNSISQRFLPPKFFLKKYRSCRKSSLRCLLIQYSWLACI